MKKFNPWEFLFNVVAWVVAGALISAFWFLFITVFIETVL